MENGQLPYGISLLSYVQQRLCVSPLPLDAHRFYERHPNIVTKIINNKETIKETQTIEKKPEVKLTKTVYIKESDLVALAVDKNTKYLLDIVVKNNKSETTLLIPLLINSLNRT